MKLLKLSFLMLMASVFVSCWPKIDPKGATYNSNAPFYITKKPEVVKHILVPTGTKLVYEGMATQEGEQDKMLDEEKLHEIKMENGVTIDWAGIPVNWIYKFFNTDMSGFKIYPDFEKMKKNKMNKFGEMWYTCGDGLGIRVKNMGDWSFNPSNIEDVEGCSVNYQRYFKDNKEQQRFLDQMYTEMMKSGKRN